MCYFSKSCTRISPQATNYCNLNPQESSWTSKFILWKRVCSYKLCRCKDLQNPVTSASSDSNQIILIGRITYTSCYQFPYVHTHFFASYSNWSSDSLTKISIIQLCLAVMEIWKRKWKQWIVERQNKKG